MGVVDTAVSKETEALAVYISGAAKAAVPDDVIEKTKHHTLDTLAAAISGAHLRPGKLAAAYVQSLGGTPECTVIGSTFLTNSVNAALANGVMAHADETDDSHLVGRFHPGCGIVPAALAAAELKGSNGLEFLKAIALGYDIGTRFNLSLGPRKLYAGGHSTHSIGPLFGATAASATLMGFSPEQVRYHLSYSVQQASGAQCWARDDQHVEKAFDFGGMTARNGLAGATMVAAGFTGVADSLSGDNNFFTAVSNDPRPDELWKELGTRYEIREATIKKWCVGSPIQATIDAITLLMNERGLTAEKVEKLTIELPDDRCDLVNDRSMPNINVQHLVALTLVDGGMNFESSHDHARMEDPRVKAIRTKTTLIPNAELTTALPPRQAIIRVETKSGETLEHRTLAVKGTPANPRSRQEVVDKAIDLVEPSLGKTRSRQLVDTVMGLETIDRVGLALRPLLQP
jgi:2-methylcitrate dehydratase PrpD